MRLFRSFLVFHSFLVAAAAAGLAPSLLGGERAKAEAHWAYRKPVRPEPPAVKDASWPRNPIDLFVLARLEKEGLTPSPPADRAALIRRVSLDLIGLPPSVEEVDAFLSDQSPDAYEKLVDPLLSSPHYGERWARLWLDLARYADTHGYENDPRRSMWRYRDWVIQAFNEDLPFDRFTIEQISGDLLPEGTLEQKISSGFHRNTMFNTEGGVDPEEARVETIVDRVHTTATIWLGTTLACTQCHDHKYDPFSQKEYYRFFAFFNNCDEPEIEAPTPAQLAEREAIRAKIRDLQSLLEARTPERETRRAEWERKAAAEAVRWSELDPVGSLSAGGAALSRLEDRSLLLSLENPLKDTYTVVAHSDLVGITALRLEVLTHPSLPKSGPGRHLEGRFVLGPLEVRAAPRKRPQEAQPVVLRNATASYSQEGHPVKALLDGPGPGWAVDPGKDRPRADQWAVLETEGKIGFEGGTTLTFTLKHPSGEANLGRFRLSATTHSRPVRASALPPSVEKALLTPAGERSEKQSQELSAHFRSVDPELKEIAERIAALERSQPKFPTTLVMKERTEQRATYIHIRGNFLNRGEQVSPGVPAVLPPLPEGQPENRLTLARWLVGPENPLTARVMVNRFWEQYFGRGLVATVEDFGTQGEPPTHPELLDFLATEFMGKGWSMKALHRLIVTSATYRQSSRATPLLLERDPEQKLLARGPRFRVEAEMVRDIGLAASGLLSRKIGGPSVFPPQPEGIWTMIYSNDKWVESTGEDRYRRGIYTFARRTAPYPSFIMFDAPSREFSCIRRPRTNTPLQALITLNDPAFVEAAQGLARRILAEGGEDAARRAAYGFRLCLSRHPRPAEVERLVALHERELAHFRGDAGAASEHLASGPGKPAEGMEAAEIAAWTVVSNVLLNLDETITKE